MKNTGRFLKEYRGDECLNCGVPLDVIDRYCHSCGQINTTKKLSLKDFFGEFFASIFSYDSRLRHTIVALLFNPGKISKDYIEGKRVKYSNPFRFYLSVSIIFFIIFGFSADFDNISRDFNDGFNEGAEEKERKHETKHKGFNFTLNTSKKTNDSIPIIEKDNILIDDSSVIKNDSISEPSKNKKSEKEEEAYFSETQLDTMNSLKAIGKRVKIYRSHYKTTKEISPKIALDSLNHRNTFYNRYVYERSVKTEEFKENPFILFKFIFDHLPFIIFFFLPFFGLGIWAIYIRRPFTYMEHLVFTFHTQTLFFILIGLAYLIDEIIESEVTSGIAVLIFLFYLYKAMRKFYNQSRIKTIVKFLLVNVLFFILAWIGIVITFVGSFFTY